MEHALCGYAYVVGFRHPASIRFLSPGAAGKSRATNHDPRITVTPDP